MINVKNTLRYSYILFLTRVQSSRTAAFILWCAIILMISLYPLKEFMRDVNQPVTIYVFTLLFSSVPFLVSYVFCIVIHFSGCPFMQRSNMYGLVRIGKARWALAQIISLFFSSLFLTGITFLMMVVLLFPHITISNEWGKIVHTLARTSIAYRYQIQLQVSPNFIFKFKPVNALFFQFIIVIGVTFLIALLLFILSLYVSKIVALGAVISLAFFNFVVLNEHWYFHEKLMRFSPISWLNTSKLGESNFGFSEFPSMTYMMNFLLIMFFILIIGIVLRIKKMDFDWVGDEE